MFVPWLKRSKQKDDSIFTQRDKHQKFYQSKQWVVLKLFKKSIQPLCEYCLVSGHTTVADDIHHTIPIAFDWSQRFNIDGLVSLCKSCHAKETRRETIERKRNEIQDNIDFRMNELNEF